MYFIEEKLYFEQTMLKIMIPCVLLFLEEALSQNCASEEKYFWSYHGPNKGPQNWKDFYPACGLKDQSPIEIMYANVVDVYLAKLKYNHFNTPITNATVQNVGWTVMVTPEDNEKRYVAWGGEIFILDQIHFHFGSKINPGAEHVIDGIRYEMEVHYVTHMENDPKTVAIVAALMKATDDHNSGFDPIMEVISSVKYKGNTTYLKSDLNLAGLLPQDSGSYYYYDGSNSIPPCESRYIWWIIKEIGEIGSNQLNSFMTLYSVEAGDSIESCLMGPNYRPLQNLDNRPIMSSQ